MSATLPSEAAWTLTAGDLLVLAGVCLLFLEIVKARRSWRAGIQPLATATVVIALALLIGMAQPASAQRSGADLPADAKQRGRLLQHAGRCLARARRQTRPYTGYSFPSPHIREQHEADADPTMAPAMRIKPFCIDLG
jgi:hypothetical protein